MRSQDIFNLGSVLVILGFILFFAGVLLSSFRGAGEFGGLILIGPIPIAFGSSPDITTAMLWAGVAIAIIYLFLRRGL
ncbi:TIGR00304 family membrane protein [Methanolobus sp. WCC5]|jgi:uncharacterized membrane protein|uniref:TIGR00304 family membrane protein n=1 Tax=Methanolobus sp. WCC5 TaxID=3125785 RepID=UPI0032464AEC